MVARLLTLLAALVTLALPALAQEQATLVSDSLEITGDTRLIADGHVEVFFKGRRLTASRIVFDQATNRLEITGPIVLTDDAGETLILASQADLAADSSGRFWKSRTVSSSRSSKSRALFCASRS